MASAGGDPGGPELWELRKVALDRTYEGLPLATLRQWMLEARIDADDLLRPAGTSDWRRADAVPELARFFAAPQAAGAERLDAGAFSRSYRRNAGRASGAEATTVDLTPFIDITFLLLRKEK